MTENKPLRKHEVSQDPTHWKWRGFIYYNPNDKRLFPLKRNPAMGYTTNFANPRLVLALLTVIAIPLVMWGVIALAMAKKKQRRQRVSGPNNEAATIMVAASFRGFIGILTASQTAPASSPNR